jgi:hypothetical protein
MYTIVLRDTKTGTEEKREFENARLAKIYKDYHLNFGHWNGKAKWVRENELALENRKFICDEMTKLENGVIVVYYHVTDGLIIEGYAGESKAPFANLRLKRNKCLQETDWTQLADSTITQEERRSYRNYRAYLRDLPKLHNEESILSAEVYSYEEWLLGKR